MAISAAQSASSSLAAGSSAAAAAGGTGAGGVAKAVYGTAAIKSSSTTTTITATAIVTTVATGVYVVMDGTGPICPLISAPDIHRGSMSFEIMGFDTSLSERQATNLTTSFVEQYNQVFGCDSEFARTLVNCTLPCRTESNEANFTNATRCCEETENSVFGDTVSCTLSCFVHCAGCSLEEPLFLVPELETAIFPTAAPTSDNGLLNLNLALTTGNNSTVNNSDSIGETCSGHYVDQGTSISRREGSCSRLYQIGRLLENELCETQSSCRLVRGTVLSNHTTESSNSSAAAVPFTEVTFLPFPSTAPTPLPSFAPSSEPSSLSFSASFYDEIGFFHGLVDGATIQASSFSLTPLTIRVDASSNVASVLFVLDEDSAFVDNESPFFIAGNSNAGLGMPFPPLLGIGSHTLTVVLYDGDNNELGSRTFSFEVVL